MAPAIINKNICEARGPCVSTTSNAYPFHNFHIIRGYYGSNDVLFFMLNLKNIKAVFLFQGKCGSTLRIFKK